MANQETSPKRETISSGATVCSSAAKPREWWINRKKVFACNIDSVSSGFSSEVMTNNYRHEGEETVHVREVIDNSDNVVIERWLSLLDDRVEGYRAMAGQCADLHDFHESAKFRMKSDVMRDVAKELRRFRDNPNDHIED